MKYDITKNKAPKMPNLGKGTECIKLLLSQASKDMHDPLVPMLFPSLAAHISGNPLLRACISLSATPVTARAFYKNELHNGTFGRMVFSYKPREANRSGRIPRKGEFADDFYKQLDTYLARLDMTKGRFVIRPLNKLIDQLAADMASLADLTDDDVLWDVSKRALVSAWKAGCVLWVLNAQTWTKAMGELVEWLVYHDLWSKTRIFADMLGKDGDVTIEARKRGPNNMLDLLPDTFNEAQLQAVRTEAGKDPIGAKDQLRVWGNRKFITYSNQTGLYTKTEEYLKRMDNG